MNKLKKDGRWAWIICGAAFCDIFIVLGIQYTFGVLFVALLDHFGQSKSSTAWVGSIAQFGIYFFAYGSSILCENFGCRTMTIIGGMMMSLGLLLSSFCNDLRLLYFTHGALFGIGSSFAYLPALVMVARYFDKRRSIATGIAAAGGNVGAIALAPLQQIIVTSFGWRNCFRFLSGFSLLTIVCGFIFKPLPEPIDELTLESDSMYCSIDNISIGPSRTTTRIRELLKQCKFPRSPRFLVWAVAGTIACFGYFMPHVHLVRLCEELGGTYRQGSLLLTYMCATSAIGKVIFGKISDMESVNTMALYQVCMVLTGLTSAVCIMATDYKMLVIYVIIIGILDGSFIGLMSIVTFECCGNENMSHAWGGVLMCMSLTMLVGAPAGSWLGDATGRYRNVFFLAGGPMLVGSLIFGLIWCFKPSHHIELEHDQRLREECYLEEDYLVSERETVI